MIGGEKICLGCEIEDNYGASKGVFGIFVELYPFLALFHWSSYAGLHQRSVPISSNLALVFLFIYHSGIKFISFLSGCAGLCYQ